MLLFAPAARADVDRAAAAGVFAGLAAAPKAPAATVVRLSGDVAQAAGRGRGGVHGAERASAGSSRSTARGRSRVGRAISQLGLRAKGVKGGGYDLLPDDLALVADGTLDFVVDQQPYVQGFAPVMQLFLARISQGTVVPWDTETSVLLRKADVQTFLATKSRFEGSSSRQRTRCAAADDAASLARPRGRDARADVAGRRSSPGSRCSRRTCATATTSASPRSASCSASPGVGAVLTLLPWGLAADRIGERVTGTVGLLGAARGARGGGVRAATSRRSSLLLAVAGAFGASINTATGRAVTSWFPREDARLRARRSARRRCRSAGSRPRSASRRSPTSGARGRRCSCSPASRSLAAGRSPPPGSSRGRCATTASDEADALRHPLRDRRIWRLSFGSSAADLSPRSRSPASSSSSSSRSGASAPIEAGLVLAAINVVGAAGRLLSGRRSDRRGGGRVALIRAIAAATAVAVAVVAALAGATGLAARAGARRRRRAVDVLERPRGRRRPSRRPGRRGAGRRSGSSRRCSASAVAVTPLVFAPFVASTSWRAGFLVAAALPLVAVVVLRPLRA